MGGSAGIVSRNLGAVGGSAAAVGGNSRAAGSFVKEDRTMEYQHGGDIYSQEVDLDFSANLNPFGLPEAVRRAAADSLGDCAVYPDSSSRKLTAALAAYHGVPQEQVICGNGAADLIFGLALALKPKRALVTAPAFSEYEQALAAVDCRVSWLDLREQDGFRLNSRELLEKLSGEPQLLFLCNPNNPTGVSISREDMEWVAGVCRKQGVRLAVDECFCDFLDAPESCSLIPFLGKYPNVFVLKAFTKLYAMAGLRLGYGLCADGELMERLKQVRQPWSVSSVAQAAGLAALGETGYVRASTEAIARERRWLSGELIRLGLTVYGSEANYIFFRDPAGADRSVRGRLYEALLERRILIRSCANYRGLDNTYYRVCVRLHEDNEILIRELERILAGGDHLERQE